MVQPLTTDYNQSIHRATLMKPFALHFGYDPKEIRIQDEDGKTGFGTTPQRYLDDLRRRQQGIKKAVKDGLDRYYENMSEDYLKRTKTRPHNFYVGQLVMTKRISQKTGESKSLGPLYIGPAEVVKVTDTTAEIVFLATNVKKLRSVTQLKPYYEDNRFPTDPARFTGLKRGDKEEEEDEPKDYGEDVVRGRGLPLPTPPQSQDRVACAGDADREEDVPDDDDEDREDAQEASGSQDVREEDDATASREEQSSLPSKVDRHVRFSSPIADVADENHFRS